MSKKIVVVSLFDGLSGGRLVADRIDGLEVVRYYSSEVDKYAIQVADYNYPQDKPYRLGSVTEVDGYKLKEEIEKDFPNTDILLIGGSPCQGFSLAGKMKGSSTKCGKEVTTLEQYLVLKEMDFEFDGQSYLFWEYVRIMKEISPTYFMLENVRITKKWIPMFNNTMGVEPTRINSSLVSAQNRDRYYWHNLGEIEQPNDERQFLIMRDVLENDNKDTEKQILSEKAMNFMDEVVKDKTREKAGLPYKTRWEHCNINNADGKAYTLTASMYKGVPHNVTIIKERPCELKEFNKNSTCHHTANATDIKGNESIKRVYAESGKSPAMTTCQGGHREPKVLIDRSKSTYRKLTPLECERLQTLPDNYTLVLDENGKQLVSNSQRYKMIGNGWTIDVPAHILKKIVEE